MSAEVFYNTRRETGRLASGSFGLSSSGALTWIDDPLESIIREVGFIDPRNSREVLLYTVIFLNGWKTAIDQSR